MARQAPKEFIMKFSETVFFHQMLAIVVGIGLLIGSFSFVAIPFSLAPAASAVIVHLT